MGNLHSFFQSRKEDNCVDVIETSQNTEIKEEEKKAPEMELLDIVLSDQNESVSENLKNSFSILSYNVLAEAYSHFLSTSTHPKFLKMSYRAPLIVKELERLNSDIICLQELDNFTRIYKPHFEALNYEMLFVSRYNLKGDGCAIGIKKDKFEFVEHHVIDLDKGHAYVNNPNFIRGNIAIVATLKHLATNRKLQIVCNHLFWDPKFEQVKYLQMSVIFRYINRNFSEKDIVIWCGDFNSKPRSNVLEFLLHNKTPNMKNIEHKDSENFEVMRTICTKLESVPKNITWGNVYANYGASIGDKNLTYPKYTNFSQKFKDTIDHILYSTPHLIPRKLLRIPTEEEIKNKALPNRHFPSDHLPIMAVFEIKGK